MSHTPGTMREIVIQLLQEIPSETIVERTMNNDIATARDVIEWLKVGDERGLAWASDLLRISRDFLVRQAERQAAKNSPV